MFKISQSLSLVKHPTYIYENNLIYNISRHYFIRPDMNNWAKKTTSIINMFMVCLMLLLNFQINVYMYFKRTLIIYSLTHYYAYKINNGVQNIFNFSQNLNHFLTMISKMITVKSKPKIWWKEIKWIQIKIKCTINVIRHMISVNTSRIKT